MIHYLRNSILIWLLAFLSAEGSIAQQYAKMSPHLRQMTHARTRAKGAQKRMVMLVRGEESALSPYCVAHQGDLHLCYLSVDEAIALSDKPEVDYLQATPSEARPCLDTLTQIVGIDKIWQGIDLPQAYTGKGVLVGVPDCGIEYAHPVFQDEHDGHLRIVRAWDALELPENPQLDSISTFPLGRLYTDAEAILKKHHSSDSEYMTHGTITTAIAAGASAGTPYRGVAYDADIYSTAELSTGNVDMFDEATQKLFTEELRLLSFTNIFSYADSVGEPCVVNYSLGDSQDMTDADAAFDEYLSRLLKPGHIIVASVGNAGKEYRYMSKPKGTESVGACITSNLPSAIINISADKPLTLRFTNYSLDEPVSYDFALDMSVTDKSSPSGLPWYDYSEDLTLNEMFGVTVSIYSGCDGSDKTRAGYDIFLNFPDKRMPERNQLTVEVIGQEADAEIFIQRGQLKPFTKGNVFMAGAEQGYGSLLSPGCLPSVIGVGATSHRINWTRFDGKVRTYSMPSPHGERADFSSVGPSLHGFVKPDVVAPGVSVVSALNSVYFNANKDDILDRVVRVDAFSDGSEHQWVVDCGTSLSAPVVAGIIALWLQADPTLTTERVREVFAKTCRRDDSMLSLPTSEPGVWPNNECGYGEIDAYRGLLEVLNLPENIPSLNMRQLTEAVVMPAADGNISVVFEAPVPHAVTCSVYALDGKLLCREIIEPGTDKKTLQMQGTTGVVVVQLEGMGSTLCRL